MDCVHKNYRIDALKRSLLSFLNYRKYFIRYSAYKTVRYLYSVNILNMCRNIVGGHTFGIPNLHHLRIVASLYPHIAAVSFTDKYFISTLLY